MSSFKKAAWIFLVVFFLEDCSTLYRKNENKILAKGLSYQTFNTQSGARAHLVKIDTTLFKPEIVQPKKKKLAELSSIIDPYKHIVAINGSFFEKEGRPSGSLKIGGKWIRKPSLKRGVLGWKKVNNKYIFYFDRLGRSKGEVTSSFYQNKWYNSAENIIGGAPLLVFNGKKLNPTEEKPLKSFLKRKYGRSAVCLHKDKKTLSLLFVEGGDNWAYRIGLIHGINISELSDLMIELGCLYALNLDGGYSSSLMVDKKIFRYPLFATMPERPIANILAFN